MHAILAKSNEKFTSTLVRNDEESKALKREKFSLYQVEKDINELLQRLQNNQRDVMTDRLLKSIKKGK